MVLPPRERDLSSEIHWKQDELSSPLTVEAKLFSTLIGIFFTKVIQLKKRRPHLVGSSKNITGGLLTNSKAMESLFR